MVDVYKVGTTLALNDLVTANLLKMSDLFATLSKEVDTLSAKMKSLNIGGVGLTSEISREARAMGEAFKFASVEIDGVRAKLAKLDTAVVASGAAGGGSGGRSGHSWAASAARNYGGIAAAFTGYEALKGGMTMEDTIARAMIAMGITIGPDYMKSAMAQGLQGAITNTSKSFGVPLHDTQEAALDAIRTLAPQSSDKIMGLLPSILKFAGVEVLNKHGTSMEEAVDAGIALAHQLKDYSPEKIEPMMSVFAKLSMATPQSLEQMTKASSYYLPLLTSGLGMDPSQLLALGIAGSQMGLNTKAGTWMAQMFQAPFASDLTSKRGSARRKALEELGLVKDGKPVTRDAFEFLNILSEHESAMTPEKRLKVLIAAFGQQGGKGAALYSDPTVLKNILALSMGLNTAPSPDTMQKQLSYSPLVQYNQAIENFMTSLANLGEAITPAATEFINTFSKIVDKITQFVGYVKGMDEEHQAAFAGPAAYANFAVFGKKNDGVPSSSQQRPIIIDHRTQIDGRTIAKSVTEYQMDGIKSAPTTGTGYDPRLTPLQSGMH